MLTVERIAASQGTLLKSIRCRALADAPEAFGTTLAEAEARPASYWPESAARLAHAADAAMFLAFHGTEACGMTGCYLGGDRNAVADLVSVWVAPEFRRLQVGQRLLGAARRWAQEHGADTLHAWVAAENAPARRFYERAGFRATDERAPMRPGAVQAALLLMMPLGNQAE